MRKPPKGKSLAEVNPGLAEQWHPTLNGGLTPFDFTTNSKRNNRSFNNCTTCEDVIDKWGNTTGSKKDANDWSFEPRDEVKGDVARMMFYMAVRYEGLDSYPDLELTESMLPQENKEPIHGVLSTLLEWHRNDPVNEWEKNRNNIIYDSYQNNRNPFIDFPIIAEHIWGTKIGVNWTGDEALGVNDFKRVSLIIYPNPASKNINIKGLNAKAQVKIYDTLGRKVLELQIDTDNNTIDVSKLKGMYSVNVVTQDKSVNKLVSINL